MPFSCNHFLTSGVGVKDVKVLANICELVNNSEIDEHMKAFARLSSVNIVPSQKRKLFLAPSISALSKLNKLNLSALLCQECTYASWRVISEVMRPHGDMNGGQAHQTEVRHTCTRQAHRPRCLSPRVGGGW